MSRSLTGDEEKFHGDILFSEPAICLIFDANVDDLPDQLRWKLHSRAEKIVDDFKRDLQHMTVDQLQKTQRIRISFSGTIEGDCGPKNRTFGYSMVGCHCEHCHKNN
jgi:hypothetical protein|tara:strand:+ start:812 stop:1132 length:321 start_codon:yes stop_codon:yes gene_type:complete